MDASSSKDARRDMSTEMSGETSKGNACLSFDILRDQYLALRPDLPDYYKQDDKRQRDIYATNDKENFKNLELIKKNLAIEKFNTINIVYGISYPQKVEKSYNKFLLVVEEASDINGIRDECKGIISAIKNEQKSIEDNYKSNQHRKIQIIEEHKKEYLEVIAKQLEEMLSCYDLHKCELEQAHDFWDKGFYQLVLQGKTKMRPEDGQFEGELTRIKRMHRKEVDDAWRVLIREWADRYLRIAGKLPVLVNSHDFHGDINGALTEILNDRKKEG